MAPGCFGTPPSQLLTPSQPLPSSPSAGFESVLSLVRLIMATGHKRFSRPPSHSFFLTLHQSDLPPISSPFPLSACGLSLRAVLIPKSRHSSSIVDIATQAVNMKITDLLTCALFAASATFTLAQTTPDDANNGDLAERGESSWFLRCSLIRKELTSAQLLALASLRSPT